MNNESLTKWTMSHNQLITKGKTKVKILQLLTTFHEILAKIPNYLASLIYKNWKFLFTLSNILTSFVANNIF